MSRFADKEALLAALDWKGLDLLSTTLLLAPSDLKKLGIPYSRSCLYSMIARGQFPKPLALGTGPTAKMAWRSSDIYQWFVGLKPKDPKVLKTERAKRAAKARKAA